MESAWARTKRVNFDLGREGSAVLDVANTLGPVSQSLSCTTATLPSVRRVSPLAFCSNSGV
jgi:hypothetical protein